jgi:phage anti-repressor protein
MKLNDFLKTYTAVPNKFIDQYYKFYEACDRNKFGIEGSQITNYLGFKNPKKFHERVRDRYILNHDYIIKKYKLRNTNNTPRISYYFTFDCFEKICMMSKTQKGNAVRDYFIILRKFIAYYHEHFANTINELTTSGKYVYIILVNKNKNIFKFGRTENIRKRLYSYATGKEKHPDILFIMIVKDDKVVENCVKLFAKNNKYKDNKELYKIDFDTLKKITFDCAELNKNLNDYTDDEKNFDTYIVYDDNLDATYIDLQGNSIGWEKGYKTIKKSKKSKKNSVKTRKNSNSSKKIRKKSKKNSNSSRKIKKKSKKSNNTTGKK